MTHEDRITTTTEFSKNLFEIMKKISPAISGLALYEFQYCLENLVSDTSWDSVTLDDRSTIEHKVNQMAYYREIPASPKENDKIILYPEITKLTRMLFVGLLQGVYPVEWVNAHFFFDVRGFIFIHRTNYYTDEIVQHFGGAPFAAYPQKQKVFETWQSVGYPVFQEANQDVDQCFMNCVLKLLKTKKSPTLIAIAGPTAAGKTEIVERLSEHLIREGKTVRTIEIDNFLTDRDDREKRGIDSEGKEALHYELFQEAIYRLMQGKKATSPRYDFVYATSSHDLSGNLKPSGKPIEIEPADIIFIEGNFPLLLEEIAPLIGVKAVYLSGDEIRMKRKWKRDMDYRKKYHLNYFRNRYFKDQFIMAEIVYKPQMTVADILVDTTEAKIWITPEAQATLKNMDEKGRKWN